MAPFNSYNEDNQEEGEDNDIQIENNICLFNQKLVELNKEYEKKIMTIMIMVI